VNGLTNTKPATRIALQIDPRMNPKIDPGMVPTVPSQRERDVALSFQFKADRSRVFYALSIPEYIEAWLQAPNRDEDIDTDDLRFVFNQVAEETFRIDRYRGTTLHSSIDGSCWVVGENQVRYLWKTTSLMGTSETLVDMKLLSSLGGCVLALKHSGFNDPAESARCRRMWQQSLERLCRLMEKN
jgi:uncharacterized protein YndB with AHSA1/START domain